MWADLLSALALVFVLEGVMPFLNPEAMKKMFLTASRMSNGSLRLFGFCSMLFGLCMLSLIR